MTDDDYLYAVLNCDDTSGEATDAAARAVYRLRVRAEKAEAAVARVRALHTCTTRTLWSSSLQQAISVQECQCGQRWPCVTIRALEGDA